MAKVELVHFINQFFAGIGGEEKADTPVEVKQGALGPGKALQALLPKEFTIRATVLAGDNYFSEHLEEAKLKVLEAVKAAAPEILIAGPALANGRYGVACAEVCNLVARELDIFCLAAMYEENPGVELYRSYKNSKVYLFPTSQSVGGMKDALTALGKFAAKLASGESIGSAAKEGYISRGIRPVVEGKQTAIERGIEMLLAKVAGRPYTSEVPLEKLETITPAPLIADLSQATIAIVNTVGIVPYGNPDGFKRHRNTQWRKYPIEGLSRLEKGEWEAIHGGHDTRYHNDNPNYGVPLDAMREMEKGKVFGRLHNYFYTTPGVQASVNVMRQLGSEMARDMKESGVNAALLVST